ncbi:MAG: SRPBCC family protein, partial [bacterium]
MRVVKFIVKSLLLLAAVFVVVGFFLPSSTSVSRSIEISTSPDKLFAYINDFRQFNRWSPWYGIDPDANYAFEGPAIGEGSKMIWSSEHPNVGSGSQEIIKSEADRQVMTQLEFAGQGTAT